MNKLATVILTAAMMFCLTSPHIVAAGTTDLSHLDKFVDFLGTCSPLTQRKTSLAQVGPGLGVEGNCLKAFLVGYKALQESPDLPSSKKLLENYRVIFNEGKSYYSVHFLNRLLPGEKNVVLGGESRLGREVLYKVDKKTFRIIQALYYQ